MKRMIVAILIPILISIISNWAIAAGSYTITDLGTLGGTETYVYAINNQGQAVGTSYLDVAPAHAFRWENGVMEDLGTLGGSYSHALDINDLNQIVGHSQKLGGYVSYPYIYENGNMSEIGDLYGNGSSPRAINNSGKIVGQASTGVGSVRHAILWENGTPLDLGVGESTSIALDINDSDQIIGSAHNHQIGTWQGFLLDNGSETFYSYLNYYKTHFISINDSSQIVGYAQEVGKPTIGFLWDNGEITNLGSLGGSHIYPWRINNLLQVVGRSLINLDSRAFIWENGLLTDLNSLIPSDSGWIITEAFDINEYGQIVGSGEINGEIHAYILNPIGERYSTNYILGRDNYGFDNDKNILPELSSLLQLEDLIGDIVSSNSDYIASILADRFFGWLSTSGHCWGMSESSSLYYKNPQLKPYEKALYKYSYQEALPGIISTQIEQRALSIATIIWEKIFNNINQKDDYELTKNFLLQDTPIVISMEINNEFHAVLAYKLIEFDNKADFYIYEPNAHSEERKITFRIDNNENYIPFYNDSVEVEWVHAYDPAVSALSTKSILRQKLSDLIPELISSLITNNTGLFRLDCPADSHLSDQFGRRIGIVDGQKINEIPSATIISEGEVEIYEIPADLSYDLQIEGNGSGSATVDIILPIPTQNKIKHVVYDYIPVSNISKAFLHFDSTVAGDLQIDEDGDGNLDSNQSASLDQVSNIQFPDSDSDTVIDIVDNCPNNPNTDQTDADDNGIGDVCECECDFAPSDGDVDGSDLAIYIADSAGISLDDFATDFGRANCP